MLSSENLRTILQPSGRDRRSYPRERVLFSALELADNNGGIVLNISEHGLAMRVVDGLPDNELTHLRFQVAQTKDWIETRVRVAWIDDPRTTVGVEFVELSQEGQNALQGWISSLRELGGDGAQVATAKSGNESDGTAAVVAEAGEAAALEEVPAQALPDDNQASNSPSAEKTAEIQSGAVKSAAEQAKDPSRPRLSIAESLGVLEARPEEFVVTAGRRRHHHGSDRKWTIFIAVLAIVVFAAEGFYGFAHFRRSLKNGPSTGQNRVAPATQTPPPAKPSESAAVPAAAGFVVQAGAMAQREDAVELADSLQQKGFPSFVFKRDSARLYEVVIGPYPSAEVAQRISKALQADGTDTFVRSWPFQ